MKERIKRGTRLRRMTVVLALGVAIGTMIMATPASGHFRSSIDHIWSHIKPKADKRYVRLDINANLPAGQRETGVFSATANAAGFSAASIGFRPRLPADIAEANAHYITGAMTTECPGVGQAAAGHLCVYQAAAVTSTFLGFFDIDSASGAGVDRKGTIMFWDVSASESRVWGTWTVRAPTGAAAARSTPSSNRNDGSVSPK